MMMPRGTLLFLALSALTATAIPQTHEEYLQATKLERRVKTPAQLGIPSSLAKQLAGGDRRVDQSTAEAVIRRMWMYANGRVEHPSPAVQAEINRIRKEKKATQLDSNGVSLLEAEEAGAEMAESEHQAETKVEGEAGADEQSQSNRAQGMNALPTNAGKSCGYQLKIANVDMSSCTNVPQQKTVYTAVDWRYLSPEGQTLYEGREKTATEEDLYHIMQAKVDKNDTEAQKTAKAYALGFADSCIQKCNLMEECDGIELDFGSDPRNWKFDPNTAPVGDGGNPTYYHNHTSHIMSEMECWLKKGSFNGSSACVTSYIGGIPSSFLFANYYEKGTCTFGTTVNLKKDASETMMDIVRSARDLLWGFYRKRSSITFEPDNLSNGGNTIVWADNVAKTYNLGTDLINRTAVRTANVMANNVEKVQEAVEKYQPIPK